MRKLLIVSVIAFFMIVTSACSLNTNTSKLQSINVGDVESLQVVGGLPGTKGSPLYLNTVQSGKTIITKIVGWISSSIVVGGQTEYGKHGYPMGINLKMNDGKFITVEPAYNCTSKINSDGSGSTTCAPVKGELVISRDSKKIRVKSPELSEWIKDGWKQEK